MLSKVAVVLNERLAMFEFGVVCEVFGLDRTGDGLPGFDFKVCGAEPGKPLNTSSPGIQVTPQFALDELLDADLVAIPAFPFHERLLLDTRVVDAVRTASQRGATVLTVCSGAFLAGRPDCSTGGGAPRIGGMWINWRNGFRWPPSIQMCCSWTRAI